jgi:hypothetical protein
VVDEGDGVSNRDPICKTSWPQASKAKGQQLPQSQKVNSCGGARGPIDCHLYQGARRSNEQPPDLDTPCVTDMTRAMTKHAW